MKKLASLSLIIAILGLVGFGIRPVYAEDCTADQNLYVSLFGSTRETTDAALGIKQESSVTSVNVFVMSLLESLNIGITGSAGNCAKSTVAESINDTDYKPGAMHFALGGMEQVFKNGPTGNIPGQYASMLLPKEFLRGSSVYAVGCGSGGLLTSAPTCESASVYWEELQIPALWGFSFSIAMIFVVVVLIISGFMIMFRSKIGGQAVVTVSMALQNVIFATGMALASYALGIFFVNLSKFLMIFFAIIFVQVVGRSIGGLLGIAVQGFFAFGGLTYLNDPFGMATKLLLILLFGDVMGVASIVPESIEHVLNFVAPTVPTGISGSIFNFLNLIQGIAAWYAGNALGGPIYLLSRLIITGGVFIAAIRIFWTVLKIYIKMLIDIILAPVLFVLMAIPGKNTGISDWLFRMFKNSLAPPLMFIAVQVIVLITLMLAISVQGTSGTTNPYSLGFPQGGPIPALTGGALSANTPLTQVMGLASLGMGLHGIIMLVLLNMVPAIPKAMEDLFSAKSTGAMQKAGEEVSKRLQSIPLLGTAMK